MKYDFGGYATKNDLKCTDGRIIRHDAFKDCDGGTVPLVWQHMHDSPENVLGHAVLENRDDGVYCYCRFNETQSGKEGKELVSHGDIGSLSIYANQLKQRGENVIHGAIREVSLVLSGANPGARIDNLSFEHGDDYETLDDEAIIYAGSVVEDPIAHEDGGTAVGVKEPAAPAAKTDDSSGSEETVQDVVDTMTDKQKKVMYFLIGKAAEDGIPSEGTDESDMSQGDEQGDEEGYIMHRNVFDNPDGYDGSVLTHEDVQAIFMDAQDSKSLKDALHHAATTYGIENIEILFPDAKTLRTTPDWVKREDLWVQNIINGTSHSPFARIKSETADITADEARARGYIKGSMKVEEFFSVAKRETQPTTIYKKQKLDRDDILDITDFDVVNWIRGEMRMMLDEEIARAILFGDGRASDSTDKINEEKIRPIIKDDELYAVKKSLDEAAGDYSTIIEMIAKARKDYKGSGNPTFYTSVATHINMLWCKDTLNRRLYDSDATLCAALGVSNIVEVDDVYFDAVNASTYGTTVGHIMGIMVNMSDYTVGTDKGGNITSFDDFDIDYNQYKYLMETRCSGCLTKPKSALYFVQSETGTGA
mgnify:CR=1 FL=1